MANNVTQTYGASRFPNMDLCAKSGTAEVGEGQTPHAWFAGFLRGEDTPYAFVVLVENGGGGSSVAGKKQMNNGAIATGLGFVLYLVLLVLELELPADLVAIAFGVVGIFNSLSVLEGRRRNREDVSYNLLWGQLALTIFLVACAVLAVRQRMGL